MNSTPPQIPSLEIAPIDTNEFCKQVLAWGAERGATRTVTYLNAHNVNLAFDDPEYAALVDGADLVYADGMGVVWGWRRLGRLVPERINAGDFIVDFCRGVAKRDLSLYLLGARSGQAEEAGRRWAAQAPGLRIVGVRDGYFGKDDEEAVAAEIRSASPDVLLVGMGVPRQEKWATRWAGRLDVPVIWCVGALFEYFGGKRSRAPMWMRRCGLEWTWRLALEPKRLGGRYLKGNFRFVKNLKRMGKAR